MIKEKIWKDSQPMHHRRILDVVNQTLADLFVKNMNELGGPAFTQDDYAFAKKITDAGQDSTQCNTKESETHVK